MQVTAAIRCLRVLTSVQRGPASCRVVARARSKAQSTSACEKSAGQTIRLGRKSTSKVRPWTSGAQLAIGVRLPVVVDGESLADLLEEEVELGLQIGQHGGVPLDGQFQALQVVAVPPPPQPALVADRREAAP